MRIFLFSPEKQNRFSLHVFIFRASSLPRVVENIGRVYAKKQGNFRCGHTPIPPISTNFSMSRTSLPCFKFFSGVSFWGHFRFAARLRVHNACSRHDLVERFSVFTLYDRVERIKTIARCDSKIYTFIRTYICEMMFKFISLNSSHS